MSKRELIRLGQQRNISLCQRGWVYISTLAVFVQSSHTALLALKDGKSTKKATKQFMHEYHHFVTKTMLPIQKNLLLLFPGTANNQKAELLLSLWNETNTAQVQLTPQLYL